jgi:hypothetical protein
MVSATKAQLAETPRADASPASFCRLWPHRVRESSWLKSLLRRLGLHHWHRLTLGPSFPVSEANFCRWYDAVVLAQVRKEKQR